MEVAVIIKHHDEDEYIVDINTDIMIGLNKYLDTYYPYNTRVFLNELPHSCKEYTIDTILIVEKDKVLSAYKVIEKTIDGWISSAKKIRSEHLFDMRVVKMSRHVISEFLHNSDMGNALVESEKRNAANEHEIRKIYSMLKEAQTREEILSKRLEVLTKFLPVDAVAEFVKMTKKVSEDYTSSF